MISTFEPIPNGIKFGQFRGNVAVCPQLSKATIYFLIFDLVIGVEFIGFWPEMYCWGGGVRGWYLWFWIKLQIEPAFLALLVRDGDITNLSFTPNS